jgi:hypothetical protein
MSDKGIGWVILAVVAFIVILGIAVAGCGFQQNEGICWELGFSLIFCQLWNLAHSRICHHNNRRGCSNINEKLVCT